MFFSHLQGDVDILDNTQVFGLLQRLTLIVLAVYTVVTAKKLIHKKLDIPVAVLSCVACVFRFIRTYLFRSFTAKIKLDAAATRMLYEKFTLYYMPIDSVVNISLLIVLICIAGKLRKTKGNQ